MFPRTKPAKDLPDAVLLIYILRDKVGTTARDGRYKAVVLCRKREPPSSKTRLAVTTSACNTIKEALMQLHDITAFHAGLRFTGSGNLGANFLVPNENMYKVADTCLGSFEKLVEGL